MPPRTLAHMPIACLDELTRVGFRGAKGRAHARSSPPLPSARSHVLQPTLGQCCQANGKKTIGRANGAFFIGSRNVSLTPRRRQTTNLAAPGEKVERATSRFEKYFKADITLAGVYAKQQERPGGMRDRTLY